MSGSIPIIVSYPDESSNGFSITTGLVYEWMGNYPHLSCYRDDVNVVLVCDGGLKIVNLVSHIDSLDMDDISLASPFWCYFSESERLCRQLNRSGVPGWALACSLVRELVTAANPTY